MLEHERAHLTPMPASFDGYVEKSARGVAAIASGAAARAGRRPGDGAGAGDRAPAGLDVVLVAVESDRE